MSASDDQTSTNLRIALPKGRMEQRVFTLLKDAGIEVSSNARNYRPSISLPNAEVKVMKPQNILEMLAHGTRDVGFAGADWVAELNVDVIEVLDTKLDQVRIVAAAPKLLLTDGKLPNQPLVVSSEYERLTRDWMRSNNIAGDFVKAFGATEAFPPDDADVIVDNSATGSTLRDNGLEIVDTLMKSSTRLFASPQAMADPPKRQRIEDLAMLLASVMQARTRVMLEVNTRAEYLDAIVRLLPSMGEATVASLFGNQGFAVKAAIPRNQLPTLIPAIKEAGATDLVVTAISQIVP